MSEISDKELANQYRQELATALQSVAEVMDRAKAQGFTLAWQGTSLLPSGKTEFVGLTVARYF